MLRSFAAMAGMVLLCSTACADEPKAPEERKLVAEAERLDAEGHRLHKLGQPAEASEQFLRALEIRRRLYPKSRYPDGQIDLAGNLNNAAYLIQAAGSVGKALPLYQEALEMYRRLFAKSAYPDGHYLLAVGLNNMGFGLMGMGAPEQALPYYEQTLAMNRRLYPEAKFPNGHPDVARSLNNMGIALQGMGSLEKALPYYEKALAMRQRLFPESRYPGGHPDLALSLNNMGFVLGESGSPERALPFFEKSLAMRRRLYPESKFPDGHADLAQSLGNLSSTLELAGDVRRALPFCEQALAMNRKLFPASKYPEGHPDLALSLSAMGSILRTAGAPEKAVPFYAEALAMRRRLYPASRYPNGHSSLNYGLNNMGFGWLGVGDAKKALPYFQEALALQRRLYPAATYPEGHLNFVRCLNNVGTTLKMLGSVEKSLPYYEEALAMDRRLTRRALLAGSEADALSFVEALPLTRDAYLSAAAGIPGTEASAYRAIWDTKAAITRVLELRHAAARVSGPAALETLSQLKELRQRIEGVLHDARLDARGRQEELDRLTQQRDVLERDLAKVLPILDKWAERDKLTPNDLAKALPAGSAFVDLLFYTHFGQDPKVEGVIGERRTPSYAAFVMAPGKTAVRIDLGPAQPIGAAVRQWREAIERGRTGGGEGERLAALVWNPISKLLPAGMRTLYLSPDGDLARLPWAALPIGGGRILLEQCAIATVPYGPSLLEALKSPRKEEGAGTVLTMGGLDYGKSRWPALPGTATEVAALATLTASAPAALAKTDASAARLSALLPKARWAHLATHGEFRAEEFAAEQKREIDARANWHEGSGDARRLAVRNPLGYVGLALSGGEMMSGLSILNLDLSGAKLVTLSACETGLGEYTGGKGVQNLQMAFQLAGCENVVASLWKVNDAATAALMAKFYHEMWVNKKEPLAALREAQLLIYHHPELIPALSGERGAPRLKEAVEARIDDRSSADRATTDTRLWAAFVLSGAGR